MTIPTLGILGGGQLGRMISLAAADFGVLCHIFTPEKNGPAEQVSARTFVAGYNDQAALKEFADSVDIITLEFENIPVETIRFLKQFKPVFPDDSVLAITQDRVREKSFCNDLGIATVPWRAVSSFEELKSALKDVGMPAVLKTARFGYDGKGQAKITSEGDIEPAWLSLFPDPSKNTDAILEGFIEFSNEVSVLVARDEKSNTAIYPIAENIHRNHILAETHIPARVDVAIQSKAENIAKRVSDALDLKGILCIELFVMNGGSLLVNEMAPRPHNSGHWTMDAVQSSQFEQMVRIACGLKLGGTEMTAHCIMQNLIGDEWLQWTELASNVQNKVHLYGKAEAKPGRKMGHVNTLKR